MKNTKIKIALVYPNKYRAGISSYAIQLLHSLFNSNSEISCERFFIPDHIKLPFRSIGLQNHTIQADIIRSADTNTPIRDFDIIAVTLQYELDYLNVLWLLDAANIPFKSIDRFHAIQSGKVQNCPVLIAGGPCAHTNPLSMLNIFDLICIGDLEPIFKIFTSFLINNYERIGNLNFDIYNLIENKKDLKDLEAAWIAPLLHMDNLLVCPVISSKISKDRTKKIFMKDWNQSKTPSFQISADAEDQEDNSAFGNTFSIEINRGCPYGCRFCMTGSLNRPFRNRPYDDIISSINEVVDQKEFEKITFIGSSVADHPKFAEICQYIVEHNLRIMIPSIRLNKITPNLLQTLKKGGLKSLTVAPESGSNRLRTSVNKAISNEEIIQQSRLIFEYGFESIKYYFLFGLPFETEEDIDALCDLMLEISRFAPKTRSKSTLTLSINPFIPKLFTPFGLYTYNYLDKKMIYLKNMEVKIRSKLQKIPNISLEFMNLKEARVQTILSQIDNSCDEFLIDFYYAGGQPVEVDKWDKDHDNKLADLVAESNMSFMVMVTSENGENVGNRTMQKINQILDFGMKQNYLPKELIRAKKNQITSSCNDNCTICGICHNKGE
jgi:radical SAM superfamily enzyme YgiQ (UPF0313 family)